MSWLEQNIMSLRKKFIEEYLSKKESLSNLCLKFGISRVSGYKWIKRYNEEGFSGLHNQSKRPHSFRKKTDSQAVDIILIKRKQFPEWGGRKLRHVLLNEGIENVPSEATINRIVKIHDQIDLKNRNNVKK